MDGSEAESTGGGTEPAPEREARPRTRSPAVTALLTLGVLYTAYFAREVLIPIALAVLLALVLGPVVKQLRRYLRLPPPVGASLVVLSLIVAIGLGFTALSAPASEWTRRLPQVLVDLETKIYPLREPLKDVQEAARRVEKAAERARPLDSPPAVVLQKPGWTETLLGETTAVVLGFFITAFLLLFLLASGDTLLRQAVMAAPALSDKKRVIGIVREIEGDLTYYLVTVSLINCGLGVAVGLAMWLTGMPTPLLWGAMAAALNFIPYLGALIGIGIVALVASATFDTLTATLVPPLSYLILTSVEGSVITPALLARRLVLNPIAVFVALMVGSWMWGVPGALLAVPLLAAVKIVCDHVEGFRTLGILLGWPGEPASKSE